MYIYIYIYIYIFGITSLQTRQVSLLVCSLFIKDINYLERIIKKYDDSMSALKQDMLRKALVNLKCR